MNLRPLQDRILVKRVEEETKTAGGLYIPETAKEKPQRGEIVARGRREHSGEGCRNEIDHAEVLTLHRLLALRPAIDPGAVTVYSTMEPCLMCYSTLLLSGVRRFVWAYEDVMGGGTNLPLSMLNPLYRGMEVHLLDQVRRDESLRLFQRFFRTGSYWQDSLLARYTLAQTPEDSP